MAFSSLTQLTKEQYDRLNRSLPVPPNINKTGNPDSRASVTIGGFTTNNVLAFTVNTINVSPGATLGIDSGKAKTIDINLPSPAVASTAALSYWTVDTGSGDGPNDEWSAAFQVNSGSTDTGTWTFTKGKSEKQRPNP